MQTVGPIVATFIPLGEADVIARISARAGRVALLVAVTSVLAARDDDPNAPDDSALTAVSATPAVITRQGAISVTFGEAVRQETALDPENFVVINTCSGLRVPGALTLAADNR